MALVAVGWRDDFRLKDWQPFMAAIIALAGGTLAYRGAMAKIYFDQTASRYGLWD